MNGIRVMFLTSFGAARKHFGLFYFETALADFQQNINTDGKQNHISFQGNQGDGLLMSKLQSGHNRLMPEQPVV